MTEGSLFVAEMAAPSFRFAPRTGNPACGLRTVPGRRDNSAPPRTTPGCSLGSRSFSYDVTKRSLARVHACVACVPARRDACSSRAKSLLAAPANHALFQIDLCAVPGAPCSLGRQIDTPCHSKWRLSHWKQSAGAPSDRHKFAPSSAAQRALARSLHVRVTQAVSCCKQTSRLRPDRYVLVAATRRLPRTQGECTANLNRQGKYPLWTSRRIECHDKAVTSNTVAKRWGHCAVGGSIL
jgi:hypothetical protein